MHRLLSLQIVRGAAANLVVLQHLTEFENRYAGATLPAIIHYADLGVDVFFVLSGFVMAAVAGRDVGPLQFLWRRAARIYPTYWLATVVILAIAAAVPGLVHEPLESISLWRSFLLIAAEPQQPVVSVGWSLVHEVYFYFVFAIFLTFRIPILTGAAAWGVVIVAVRLAAPEYFMTFPVLRMMTSPLTFEFMMGLVVGVLWVRGYASNAISAGVAGTAMLILMLGLHYHFFAEQLAPFGNAPYLVAVRVVMFGVPITLILYSLVAYERQASLKPPALFVAIGDWSYSIYLFHFMALSALGRAILFMFPGGGIAASVILFVAGLMVANIAGAAIYVLFERPTLKRLHRMRVLSPQAVANPISAGPIT
jgi:peptidoglycan/LPS O-acetylase OafA/YrhL